VVKGLVQYLPQVWFNCEQPLKVFQYVDFETTWLANNIATGNVEEKIAKEIPKEAGRHHEKGW